MKTSLSPTVLLLSLVSLLTDVSSEMIYPLIPGFLAVSLGAQPWAIAVIEGCAQTLSSLLQGVSGRLTDRSGRRKPLTLLGYGLSGTVRPLVGLATSWPLVLVIRLLDRVGKGLRSAPRDALIADVTPPEKRGAAFGFHQAADHAGATIGPLLAGLLLATTTLQVRDVFLLAAIPGVLAFLVLTQVKEPNQAKEKLAKTPPPRVPWHSWPQPFRRLVVATLVFTLGNSTDALILLKLHEVGVPDAATAALWALHNLGKMGTTTLFGRLSDRLGRKPLILAGWLLYALVYVGLALTHSQMVAVGLFLLYSAYFGLTEPVEKAWVVDLVPQTQRGSALGLWQAAIGVSALPASLLAGLLWTWQGSWAAFGLGALLAGLGALLLLRVKSPQPA